MLELDDIDILLSLRILSLTSVSDTKPQNVWIDIKIENRGYADPISESQYILIFYRTEIPGYLDI